MFFLGVICLVLSLREAKIRLEYLYAFVYAVMRFVLEFFRGDEERGGVAFLSTSQIISVLIMAFALFRLFIFLGKYAGHDMSLLK